MGRDARSILVVDDDEAMRGVVQRLLARRGYEVVAVPDGAAALEAASEKRFDVALIDFVMPQMDGRDLVLALRAASPALRAVLMSGGDRADDAAAVGATFIGKPFAPAALAAVIEGLFTEPRLD
ncbi:MAG: response regulator [Polyangiaceae bacterium]